MIWLHIVDDYYLQGVLANMKQKEWWKNHTNHYMYRNDYKAALIAHAFSWSFVIMIPAFICAFFGFLNVKPLVCLLWFAWNIFVHARTDNSKANKQEINLVTDQLIHLGQIIATWAMCFIAFN